MSAWDAWVRLAQVTTALVALEARLNRLERRQRPTPTPGGA